MTPKVSRKEQGRSATVLPILWTSSVSAWMARTEVAVYLRADVASLKQTNRCALK
jgi:hypothetical protein